MRVWSALLCSALLIGTARPAIGQAEREKSYLLPAVEIVVFDALLNLFDRVALGEPYHTSMESIRKNLRTRWVVENDPFEVNQFGHPYQGSMYYGFARSAGHNFLVSSAYTFAGSALWEIAGETSPPSWNDQITTGVAGSLLGEALFRIGSLILETGPSSPGAGRRLVAAAVSPSLAVTRRVSNRFDEIQSSRGAAYYRRIQLGATGTTRTEGDAGVTVQPAEGVFDLSMEYGLPGAEGYTYRHPFDYFSLQASLTTGSALESVLLRGLLLGRGYEVGSAGRGVWGLYGTYDYIAPPIFRVSSSALALGTTGEWRLSNAMALQATALAGAGYAAVGAITNANPDDYHYGIAPHALVASRLIFSDRAALDVSARDYYVSNVAGTNGHDNIARADASFTIRFHKQQALAVRYLVSRRDAFFPETGSRRQLHGTLGVFLTMLGHDRFGAVR